MRLEDATFEPWLTETGVIDKAVSENFERCINKHLILNSDSSDLEIGKRRARWALDSPLTIAFVSSLGVDRSFALDIRRCRRPIGRPSTMSRASRAFPRRRLAESSTARRCPTVTRPRDRKSVG